MPPTYARELHTINLVKGVHATTAIEGNTLSEEEVAEIVRRNAQEVERTSSYREQEVANVLRVYNDLTDRVARADIPVLTPELILNFNAQVLETLSLDAEIQPGKLRQHSVVVGPYRGPDWENCESLLSEMCTWLNSESFASEGDLRIPMAILKAALAHLYLASIHPFGDGNGRTARLCEFLVLITSGVPTSAAHLISNHCNNTRDEYYRQLRHASESGGDVSRFVSYCAEGFVSGLQDQLEWVYDRQLRLAWHEYVGDNVPGRDVDVKERRTLVAETLFDRRVGKDLIIELTPALARAYARSGPKVVTRDLQELVDAGLVEETNGTYRAKTEVLLSLLSLVVPE